MKQISVHTLTTRCAVTTNTLAESGSLEVPKDEVSIDFAKEI